MRPTPANTTIPMTTPNMTSHTSTGCCTGEAKVGTIPTNSRVWSFKLNAWLIRPRLNLQSSEHKEQRSEIKVADGSILHFEIFYFSNCYSRMLTLLLPQRQPLGYKQREFWGPWPKYRRRFVQSHRMPGRLQLCECEPRENKHHYNSHWQEKKSSWFIWRLVLTWRW